MCVILVINMSKTQKAKCSEDMFYSSLYQEYPAAGMSVSQKSSEDNFDTPLNMECSEGVSDQSGEEGEMSLDLQCTDCDNTVISSGSQSPVASEMISFNELNLKLEPFETDTQQQDEELYGQPKIQFLDTGQQDHFESETLPTDTSSLYNISRTACYSSSIGNTVKEPSYLKGSPDCDVVVMKSGEQMIICETMPKHSLSGSVQSWLPRIFNRNRRRPAVNQSEQRIITHDIGTLKSICDNSTDLNKFSSVTSSEEQTHVGCLNQTHLEPVQCVVNVSETGLSRVPCSVPAGCEAVDSKVNNAPNKSYLSSAPQEVSTARHVRHVLIDSSTAYGSQTQSDCLADPTEGTIYSTNQQSHSQVSGSWIECDERGWLYYVRPGRTRFLKLKIKDISTKRLEVVHSLVSRILALELCLKHCTGNDKANLLSYIELEKSDAQDLEQLLNSCRVNTQKNTNNSSSQLSNVEYQLHNSTQAVTNEESTTTSIPSTDTFLNVDDHSQTDSTLSIRIESVFSLSTAAEIDSAQQSLYPVTHAAQQSPKPGTDFAEELPISAKEQQVHQQLPVLGDHEKKTSMSSDNIVCSASTERNNSVGTEWTKLKGRLISSDVPPYVVLERLTDEQVRKARHTSRCTPFCRKVTLQLMCDLGLTDCRERYVKSDNRLWGPHGFNINCDHNYACRSDLNIPVKGGTKRKNTTFIKIVKPVEDTDRKVNGKFTKLSIDPNSVIKLLPKPGQNSAKKILKFTKVGKASIPSCHFVSSPGCAEQAVDPAGDADHSFVVNRPSQTVDNSESVNTSESSRPSLVRAVNVKQRSVSQNAACQTDFTTNILPPTQPDSAQSVGTEFGDNVHLVHAVAADDGDTTDSLSSSESETDSEPSTDSTFGSSMTTTDMHSVCIPGTGLVMRVEGGGQSSGQVGVTTVTVHPKTRTAQTPTNTTTTCITKPVTDSVNTKCSFNQSAPSTNHRYVSLLPEQPIPSQNAIVLSSKVYRNPDGPRVASDIEIVLNSENGSTSCSSTRRIDPKERYAMCLLNNKSYLVQLSKNETITLTGCNGIVSRLMKHIAAKQKSSSNMRSLLTKPMSSLLGKVQPTASSKSVASCPVTTCGAVSGTDVKNTVSSVCVSSSLPRSLLSTFNNMKRTQDTLPTEPVKPKVPRIRLVTAHSDEKTTLEKHTVSQPKIECGIPDDHSQTKSSPSISESFSKVSIKKEPVDEIYDHRESMDFRFEDRGSAPLKEPEKERCVGQWQQIWCSNVMPTSDPAAEGLSPSDARSSLDSKSARSGESIFEKMYSEFNLLHAPSTFSDSKPQQTPAADGHYVLVSSGKPAEERRSLYDVLPTVKTEPTCQLSSTEGAAEHSDLPPYDVMTPPITETDTQENALTAQQMRIQLLKERLREKEEELRKLREKNMN